MEQEQIAESKAAAANVVPLREARRAFERRYILAALEQHRWRISETARALGLQRPNLYRKARQLAIPLRPPSEPS
ncbi:MAG: helix-turn-helix domain-containing protein [Vicinamibacterales bacterium]